MQRLTAEPRDGFTDEQVRTILQADSITVTAGVELLDVNDVVVGDISGALLGGTVSRNNNANVHGTCSLDLDRELAWGRDRVRPYMSIGALGTTARFNLGVFLLTTPVRNLDPVSTYSVDGYDKLHILQTEVGDAYSVPAGANYLTSVRSAIATAGGGTRVLLDTTASAKVLPTAMVWPLVENDAASYLNVVNDLLSAIGYRGLWCDSDGNYRSEPYVLPQVRPLEWAFNVDDPRTTLVAEDRKLTADTWGVPNWTRYIRRGLEGTPFEGGGFVTLTNQSDGPTSIEKLGRQQREVVWVDAADQASLLTLATKGFATARQVTATVEVSTAPLPIAGHFDVVRYVDSRLSPDPQRLQAREWSLPLDGSDMTWTFEVI